MGPGHVPLPAPPVPSSPPDAGLAPAVVAGLADCEDVALFHGGEMTGGGRADADHTLLFRAAA